MSIINKIRHYFHRRKLNKAAAKADVNDLFSRAHLKMFPTDLNAMAHIKPIGKRSNVGSVAKKLGRLIKSKGLGESTDVAFANLMEAVSFDSAMRAMNTSVRYIRSKPTAHRRERVQKLMMGINRQDPNLITAAQKSRLRRHFTLSGLAGMIGKARSSRPKNSSNVGSAGRKVNSLIRAKLKLSKGGAFTNLREALDSKMLSHIKSHGKKSALGIGTLSLKNRIKALKKRAAKVRTNFFRGGITESDYLVEGLDFATRKKNIMRAATSKNPAARALGSVGAATYNRLMDIRKKWLKKGAARKALP